MADDPELTEYFALNAEVAAFDQRLLTIKGWGVTLGLAALGFGFQYRSYGMFLVATTSGVAFWALEAVTKRHQMRHYPRIREIEVNRCVRATEEERPYSAPRISWSWYRAPAIFAGRDTRGRTLPEMFSSSRAYQRSWLLPHIAIPHIVTVLVGLVLFLLGWSNRLDGFGLGAMVK